MDPIRHHDGTAGGLPITVAETDPERSAERKRDLDGMVRMRPHAAGVAAEHGATSVPQQYPADAPAMARLGMGTVAAMDEFSRFVQVPRGDATHTTPQGAAQPMLCAMSPRKPANKPSSFDLAPGTARSSISLTSRLGGWPNPRPKRLGRAVARDLRLSRDIARGIAHHEFYPVYQPIARTQDDQVVSAEVLCRWRRPDGRSVSPARVISRAEQSGLIFALDDSLIRNAFGQQRRWALEGRRLSLSINLSGHQFSDQRLIDRLSNMTAAADVLPNDVQLEITETVLVRHRHRAAQVMQALRALGFRIALDDFGKGYSNLSYLQDFPVDTIKIDRSFLKEITAKSRGRAIVRAVTAMAHDVGAQTVIEGVETVAELNAVRALGVTYYQGFLLGRPGTPEALMTAVRSNQPAWRLS